MNGDAILSALDLPASSRVDQRVPKKLLLESGTSTAADKRIINDGIEELLWIAALKPTTIGVPEYRDDVREYLEIAVVRLTMRSAAKATRLVELMHRVVPYPMLLLTEQGETRELSAAHKRWSQGGVGKTVLEGDVVTAKWDVERDGARWPASRNALELHHQPHTTLNALYQGWIDTLLALNAARLTGSFALPINGVQATTRIEGLREYAQLERQIARLRTTAAKEKQLARKVELNLMLNRVQTQLAVVLRKL